MRITQQQLLQRIGQALRQSDEIVHEPLPNRWVDLINYLNEQEKMRPEALHRNSDPGFRTR